MKNIQEILDKHYDEMLDELFTLNDTNLYEFKIEVKLSADGTTIRRSWKDRDYMLKEENE